MRLWPRSLFGRTLLVIAGGLALAQTATQIVNFLDRGSAVYRLSSQQMAARIAQAARMLDRLPDEARADVIEVAGSPDLQVSLSSEPITVARGDFVDDPYERVFAATVQRALDRPWPVTAKIAQLPRARDAPPVDASALDEWLAQHLGFLLPENASVLVQIRLEDGDTAVFFARLPQERLRRLESLLPRLLVWIGVFFILTAVVVRMVTRPLQRLADAAEALGRDPERPPLTLEGPTEVRGVIEAFNHMQSEVRAYVLERTRLLGAISHDLKTPITRMRLRAEMLPDGAVREKFVRDLEDMEAMVGSTLEFFRALGKEPQRHPVDVTALIESIVDDFRETGHEVPVAGVPLGTYLGHPEALRRCLNNLVENALRYGERAGITIDDAPEALRILVRDHGPGIPPGELERVFEPFFRLEASRNRESGGSGLGLSIARNIARWHGGEVRLSNAPGGGLLAELRLPRSRPALERAA
ncbi:MAG TPA: ATP-binding protein [Burkholderiales bacterium]